MFSSLLVAVCVCVGVRVLECVCEWKQENRKADDWPREHWLEPPDWTERKHRPWSLTPLARLLLFLHLTLKTEPENLWFYFAEHARFQFSLRVFCCFFFLTFFLWDWNFSYLYSFCLVWVWIIKKLKIFLLKNIVSGLSWRKKRKRGTDICCVEPPLDGCNIFVGLIRENLFVSTM